MKQRLKRISGLETTPSRGILAGLLGMMLLMVLGLPQAGCDESRDDGSTLPPIRDREITVLATVYPLADVARQVGGDFAKVEWVAESGQPLPTDQPNAELRARTDLFAIVISSGEMWAVSGFDDPFRAQRVVRLDVLPSADTGGDAQQPISTSPQTARAAGWSPGLLWLDPAIARELADELVKRFSQRVLRHQPYFRERADRFIEELDRITDSYAEVLTATPPRKALVLSGDWDRLLHRFGIEPLRPITVSPTSSLTHSQIRDLTAAARANRITSLFVSADTPPAVIQDLQRRTDLTVLTLDPLGTSAPGGRNSYLEILRYNLDQLNRGASRGQ